MENREVIAALKTLCNTCTMFPKCVNSKPECFQAIETAISALEKQEQDRWISVKDRLPEDDTEVFVYLFDSKSPYIAWICDGRWYTEEFEVEKENEPVAWRPLPEPYKAEEEA